ncbi:uncharacterized protein LOC101203162 [Cucumis sativus]|uniref:Extracellular ligand-gated ion channel n=1 Tax=Cucumis sativus TaxID=3659 RepID=A0A0A0M3M6_CUCSA|nr:uncharacterized protein LOC101203162 [Cucumis sativus]
METVEKKSQPQIDSQKSKSAELESELEAPELRKLESFLRWICIMDHSNLYRASVSCIMFFVFGIAVPIASHFGLSCSDCDEDHQRPFHVVVQLSLSAVATLSFLCLSLWLRVFGLNRFLFLDKLCEASPKIRAEYFRQLQKSMKLMSFFLLPCFMAEAGYKIWWYISAAKEIPYYTNNMYISYVTSCTLELCSWLYRTSIFFFVCIFFRLICCLQMIRLEDFASSFRSETEVGTILIQHLGLRRTFTVISHRFRVFMLLSLILVTASQFISLLMTTRSKAHANLSKSGQLALCSISLVTGLFICLRSAAKITHKAQSITCLAAKWHVSAVINTFDELDTEMTPTASFVPNVVESNSDDEDGDEDEDDLDDAKLMPVFAHTISFQKRQALVTYLRNNKAGITVYGFMVDRTWLKSIFAIELALFLWLLNKTVGVS